MITFRRATIEDIDNLIDLRIEFLYEALKKSKDTPEENLRKSLVNYFNEHVQNDTFIAWFALENNEIIATSGLSFYTVPPCFNNQTGEVAYIMNMYTKPNYRRKGIGTELFFKLLEEAKTKGIKKIVLHATDDGHFLYEKHGFISDGSEMILKIKE
ncbi:MAG TPA: GNAT family N-acetyltransferase [candidate division Zixibacteria bacterium]|nr:GNAT family N-acetyltransferase [candidate division Zixibacteria bacterium]